MFLSTNNDPFIDVQDPKKKNSVIRVTNSERFDSIDVRFMIEQDGEKVFTKKGISIPKRMLSEVLNAIGEISKA
jgi:hypothetical protein